MFVWNTEGILVAKKQKNVNMFDTKYKDGGSVKEGKEHTLRSWTKIGRMNGEIKKINEIKKITEMHTKIIIIT